MIISANNNLNFQARIKITKPTNKQLVLGAGAVVSYAASVYADSYHLCLIPNIGYIKNIYNKTKY